MRLSRRIANLGYGIFYHDDTPQDRINACMVSAKRQAGKIVESPCLIADNVYDLSDSAIKDQFNVVSDFPLCVAPYDSLFVEYSLRETSEYLLQVGVLMETYARDSEMARMQSSVLSDGFEYHWIRYEHVWVVNKHSSGKPFFTGFTACSYIAKDGHIVRCGDNAYLPKERQHGTFCLILPVYLALSLCNAKNVSMNPIATNGHCEGAKIKGKEPTIRYHVLEIDGIKRTLETEGDMANVGLKRALHLCRGHFAFYGENNKLFGKHSGLIWRPQHVRGSAKQGVVVKDYSIAAPKT